MLNKSMLIISTVWNNQLSFKLIPTTKDCPYNEVIFDPNEKALAVVSKEKKSIFHMMPKLDDNGDLVPAKRKVTDKAPYKEQRVAVETYYEYYITNKTEIIEFVKGIAINTENDFQAIVEEAFNKVSEAVVN